MPPRVFSMRHDVVGVVVALAPSNSAASAEGDATAGTVAVASRTFLVGKAPFESEEILHVRPLTSVAWLRHLTLADPVLDGAVVHIQMPPSPPAWALGPEGIARNYGNRDGVPNVFRAEGLVAETTREQPGQLFYFHPDARESEVAMFCGDPNLAVATFLYCEVNLTYPLDPAILLKARLYCPPLPELASRAPGCQSDPDRIRRPPFVVSDGSSGERS